MRISLPRVLSVAIFGGLLVGASSAWAQCPAGTVSITADRDNTLYENSSGTLSNGAGNFLFAGRTGQGSDEIRRGLVHFDVAGAVSPGSTVVNATLQLVLNQPNSSGVHSIELHTVTSDWGEGTSLAPMGEGGGGAATTNDATWVNTFFNTANWTTLGGDFDPTALVAIVVNGAVPGTYAWQSAATAADAQNWLDTPAANFGWMLTGDETSSGTALRFATRENTGNEPLLCLEVCPSASCVFVDGFESGDTTAWDLTTPP